YREDVLAGEEHALDVDVDDPVPAFLAGLDGAARLGDADVVVQDVDPAEWRDTLLHRRGDVACVRNVGRDGGAGAAFATDDAARLLRGREGAINGDDLRPLAREGNRCRFAVAPAGCARTSPDGEGHFLTEPVGHGSLLTQMSP